MQHQQQLEIQEQLQQDIQEVDEMDGQNQSEEQYCSGEEEELQVPSPIAGTQQIIQNVVVEESEGLDDKQLLAEFMTQQTRCEGPGRFVCNLCRKEFKHLKWLQSHIKSHTNWIKANCKKLPQCEICGKSFRGIFFERNWKL